MLWGSKSGISKINKQHRHTMHELFICMNSDGTQYVENSMCHFMKGRGFFLPEGSVHYIAADPGRTAKFAFVCFESKHFLNVVSAISDISIRCLRGITASARSS